MLCASRDAWHAANLWSMVHSELGAKPMDLAGTAEAEAIVRAAEAQFAP